MYHFTLFEGLGATEVGSNTGRVDSNGCSEAANSSREIPPFQHVDQPRTDVGRGKGTLELDGHFEVRQSLAVTGNNNNLYNFEQNLNIMYGV